MTEEAPKNTDTSIADATHLDITRDVNVRIQLPNGVTVWTPPPSRALRNQMAVLFGRVWGYAMSECGVYGAAPVIDVLFERFAKANNEMELYNALIAEINRATSCVVADAEKGFVTMKLGQAKQAGKVDERDYQEVMNTLLFFTLGYFMTTKAYLGAFLLQLMPYRNMEMTSLTLMDIQTSLQA